MLHFSCWQFYCQSAETAPDFHQPNDLRKRWDLVSRRNVSSEEAALVCGGRLFHSRAAATEIVGERLMKVYIFGGWICKEQWTNDDLESGEGRRWLKKSSLFAGKNKVTPLVTAAGDTNLSDATEYSRLVDFP